MACTAAWPRFAPSSRAHPPAPAPSGARAKFIRHFTATHQIDVVSPTEAQGRCYFVVFTDRGADHWGRYLDDYRCVDGRWLFAARKVTVDGSVPGGWADTRLRGE